MKRKILVPFLAAAMAVSCLSVPTMALGADQNNGDGSGDGSSAESNIISEKPDVSASVKSYDSVKLTWKRIENAGSYKVYQKKKSSGWKKIETVQAGSRSRVSVTADDLVTGRKATFKVKAMNDESTLESEPVSATPQLKKTTISGTVKGSRCVKLKWKTVAGAERYTVYRRVGSKGSYKKLCSATRGRTATSNNMKPGATTTYKVVAQRQEDGITAKATAVKSIRTPSRCNQNSKYWKGSNARELLKLAKTKRGCAYKSGAQGPNSFDCSGYVWWVYKTAKVAGKKFARSTAADEYQSLRQYSIGGSLKKAQPGDIVFITHGGGIDHVALYYGDGLIIHASSPSTGVIVSPVYGSVVDIVRLPNM
ncbi:MAG: NlpC/P60 family protein [Anaerovoracaceae bacterium]|jgi:cell wall-associated NlpC family hydrolase